MARKYYQGVLSTKNLKHPEKYVGKLKDNIVFRSSWELSFCKYLDMNENVLEWSSEENPILYTKPTDRRTHRYFPDFYVKYLDKKNKITESLVEIKPYAQVVKPEIKNGYNRRKVSKLIEAYAINQAKWRSARGYCYSRGWRFFILTEKDIVMTPVKKLQEDFEESLK